MALSLRKRMIGEARMLHYHLSACQVIAAVPAWCIPSGSASFIVPRAVSELVRPTVVSRIDGRYQNWIFLQEVSMSRRNGVSHSKHVDASQEFVLRVWST
jgi:hypothetical protein